MSAFVAAIACPAITMPEDGDGDATWPSANAGPDDVIGNCPQGYTGIPIRRCTAVGGVGIWQAPDSICTRRSDVPREI